MSRSNDSFHRVISVKYLLPDPRVKNPSTATLVIEMDDATEEVDLFADNAATLIPSLVHPKDQ